MAKQSFPRFLGLHFPSEVQQAAETLHPPTGPSREVAKKVDIVAGLGEKHKGRADLVSPVAPHKRVGHVPIRDIFGVLDRHHFPDSSFPYQPVDLEEMRSIAQHMGYRKDDPRSQDLCDYFPAFLFGGSHGLFQQEVIASMSAGHGRFAVLLILRGKNYPIRHCRVGQKILPILENCRALHLGKDPST